MVYKLCLLSQLLLAVIVASNDEVIGIFGVVDKPLTLSCPLPVSSPAQLKWKDWVHTDNRHAAIIFTSSDNTYRVPNERHSQADNYEIDENFRLTMKRFSSDDVGRYGCESTVNKTKHEQKFDVSALGDFSCDGKIKDVKEGEALDLRCHATYRGKLPTIAWYRGETVTESEQMIDFGTADYKVSSAGEPDMNGDTFTCRMVYGQDMVEECHVKVTVEYSVRNLTFTPKKTEYHANEKVKVTAMGNPTPKILCTMPDKTVKQRDGTLEFTIKEEWIGENKKVDCSAMSKVADADGSDTKTDSIVFKTLGHKPIAEPTAKAKAEAKPEPKPAKGSACGLYDSPIETRALLIGALVTFVLSQASIGQILLVASLPLLLGKALYNKSMIIIICIVVAVVVLIIIVVAVICARRKKSQKRQRLPTKEEEVRRLEDGKA